jgi:hypothetical protein
MRLLRQSSLEEYAKWYLERQRDRKGDLRPIPEQPEQLIGAMWERHCGKMRKWFDESTRWYIVELDAVDDLPNLVFLECPWTKAAGLVIPDGPNYRLLRRVSENALASNYLNSLPPDHPEHKNYYDALERAELQLVGKDRIAICSAESTETASNPTARYYLLDGVGRCLPYMMLLLELKMKPLPVEGFLAQRV